MDEMPRTLDDLVDWQHSSTWPQSYESQHDVIFWMRIYNYMSIDQTFGESTDPS